MIEPRTDSSTPNPARSPGWWARTWGRFRRRKLGMIGLGIVVLLMLTAAFSDLLANSQPIVARYEGKLYFPAVADMFRSIPLVGPHLPKAAPFRLPDFNFAQSYQPGRDWALWPPVPYGPTQILADAIPLQAPSRTHWLGTDENGRDVASRMIHGTSVSMQVGFVSMGLAALIGIVIGAIAGYCGGWVDILISRFIEIVMCFPTFFLILAVLAWLPANITNVMIVIGLTNWTGIARYTRGEYLRLRGVDYASAARALGAGPMRIIFRHLLPNSLAPVIVSVTFGVASAILVEASLSWLGFGVQPPDPSWGSILHDGYENLMTADHMMAPSCIAIFIAVLAFNLVGDALRDAVDTRVSE